MPLITNEDGNAWGGARFTESVGNTQFSNTDQINSGTFTITKLDFENNIVSGLFEMTVQNPFTGELIQITQGRFDTLFTE